MTTWHAPPDALARFARSPETIDDVTASSIEQHLVVCADCRSVVARAADPAALHQSWLAVADIVDRPRRTAVERTLEALGMPSDLARVVGATPGFRLAWFATIALVAAGAVALGHENGSDTPFLLLAPLLPLGSVLIMFLPAEEPGGEAAAATPLFGAGIVLRRAATVLVPTFVILAAAGVALPDITLAARWLLPGLALTLASLALATYLRPDAAIAGLGAGWLLLVTSARLLDGRAAPLASPEVFGWPGQLLALALALLSAALLYQRRDRFSTVEVTW
ncbi:MAG: hypothetical protein ABIY48_06960 [Acidimicrobiales bacterium]